MTHVEGAPATTVIALATVQLEDLAARVEEHGIELGLLLEPLMSLIARHSVEARALDGEAPSGERGEAAAQLGVDHETMLRFADPLLVNRQFHDRLKQRIDHIRGALSLLAAEPLETEAYPHAVALFPFEEERAASARACGVAPDSVHESSTEIFGS